MTAVGAPAGGPGSTMTAVGGVDSEDPDLHDCWGAPAGGPGSTMTAVGAPAGGPGSTMTAVGAPGGRSTMTAIGGAGGAPSMAPIVQLVTNGWCGGGERWPLPGQICYLRSTGGGGRPASHSTYWCWQGGTAHWCSSLRNAPGGGGGGGLAGQSAYFGVGAGGAGAPGAQSAYFAPK
ncbi:hypothetical protein COOONC_26745 [Cooperia oncophora]